MSQQYPGGFVQKTPPTVTTSGNQGSGSASGIWTLEQAGYYKNKGVWPQPVVKGLWSWGNGDNGRSGLNSTSPVSFATAIGGETTWSSVACGVAFTLATKTSGSLWSWGNNNYGQLGQVDRVARSSPVQVGALTTWSKVGCGQEHSLAIKTDGTLWAWGRNAQGELGDNTVINRSSPVQIGAQTNWLDAKGSETASILLKTNGTMWSMGNPYQGMTAQNTTSDYMSSPTQIGALTTWASISCGKWSGFAIKNDGTLWSWGDGGSGQTGRNTTEDASNPVQVGVLTDWSKIGASAFGCSSVKTNGTLWAWGDNGWGQLGQNDLAFRSSPVQIGGQTNWSNSYGGVTYNNNFLFLKTNGSLWACGQNDWGQLGLGNTIPLSSPVQVGLANCWTTVALGDAFCVGITNY